MGSVPQLGWSLGEAHGNPLQYSCLEKSHGQRILAGYSPTNSRTWLRQLDTHTGTVDIVWTMHMKHTMENILLGTSKGVTKKAMAPLSSTLAWKIPWMEEPGRLQYMGSIRVGHYWAASLSFFTFMHWRRKWQPTPAFLPGESQGWRSQVGRCLWGCTESDTTEVT